MHFFLYEIAARFFGLFAMLYSGRILWRAWVERKITTSDTAFFVFYREWNYSRDKRPVMYWLTLAGWALTMFGGFIILLFGWIEAPK